MYDYGFIKNVALDRSREGEDNKNIFAQEWDKVV